MDNENYDFISESAIEQQNKIRNWEIKKYGLSEDASDEEIEYARKVANEKNVNETLEKGELDFIRKSLQIPVEVSDEKIKYVLGAGFLQDAPNHSVDVEEHKSFGGR